MTCARRVGDLEIIFGKGTGEIKVTTWNKDSFKINDSITSKGATASFQAFIAAGSPIPETDSICLIRQISSSGFTHIFTGRYEQEAVEIKIGPYNYQFQINSFIDFCHREWIEDYSRTTTFEGHIQAALEESGAYIPGHALSLLDLQTPIVGDDGAQFKFEFKAGNLESFLDAIVALKKARWIVKPLPWVDYTAKNTGTFGVIEIIINGVTTNRATPYKLDPKKACTDGYIKFLGNIKESRKLPVASRFVCSGRNGRKDPVII